jgi:hypothetical protein
MVAAPRPSRRDDPWFSLRCALGITAALALIEPLGVNPSMILPAMLVSLLRGQRGPYTPVKSIVTAVILVVLIWLIFGLCVLTQGMPAVQFLTLLMLCYGALYLLLRTGNPLGVMLLIFTALVGVLFGNSRAGAEAMRDAFTITAVVSAVLIPLLNLLLPPRPDAAAPPPPPPPVLERPGFHALLRLAVLAPVLLAFLAGAPTSGLIFLIVVALVLAYPTRQARQTEGWERSISTVQGGLAGGADPGAVHLPGAVSGAAAARAPGGTVVHRPDGERPRHGQHLPTGSLRAGCDRVGRDRGHSSPGNGHTRLMLTIAGAAFGLTALSLLE